MSLVCEALTGVPSGLVIPSPQTIETNPYRCWASATASRKASRSKGRSGIRIMCGGSAADCFAQAAAAGSQPALRPTVWKIVNWSTRCMSRASKPPCRTLSAT